MRLLFQAAIFLNAFLLFLIQPMFAKMALPLLGGSAAVWTTCVLFFQAALLAGYLYSHVTVKLLGVRRQSIVHAVVVIVPLFLLPVGIPVGTSVPAVSAPAAWLVGLMAVSLGLPFLMLSATAPLLQRWLAAVSPRQGADPYFLYAASNAGSLAGLLLYPAVIEPLLPVRLQRLWWSAACVLTATLLVACAVATWRSAGVVELDRPVVRDVNPGVGRRLRWLVLAAIPSALMLAVTFHISTDIAAVPLLWIVPLGLYLSTFVIVFSSSDGRVLPIARRALPLILLPLVMLLVGQVSASLWFVIPLHLAAFWLLALLCHAELARTRPSTFHLTEFYVWLAVGGMLGGLFDTFIAPRLFTGVGEYPLLIAVACLGLAEPAAFRRLAERPRLLILPALAAAVAAAVALIWASVPVDAEVLLPLLGISALLCFMVSRDPARFGVGVALLLMVGAVSSNRAWGRILYAERTFFGVYRITSTIDGRLLSLFHGTTLHGSQSSARGTPPEPLSYYHRQSPIGRLFTVLAQRPIQSVGVVGLGVGSLAAYARADQRWTFYEIDPTVERIARDQRYFTFLSTCGERCRVVIGDGRLSLDFNQPKHDLIVLDAFSSDAIPVHLLTREALEDYTNHLQDNGVLAFHISNRHFDLEPVLTRVAADRRLVSFVRGDPPSVSRATGELASDWLVMTKDPAVLMSLGSDSDWKRTTPDGRRAWTDDFSNVWGALKGR